MAGTGKKSSARDNRVTTAIRLSPQTLKRLKAAAQDRDVSVNYLITKAVDRFLEKLPPLESVA